MTRKRADLYFPEGFPTSAGTDICNALLWRALQKSDLVATAVGEASDWNERAEVALLSREECRSVFVSRSENVEDL
jgi:hypothetical protein